MSPQSPIWLFILWTRSTLVASPISHTSMFLSSFSLGNAHAPSFITNPLLIGAYSSAFLGHEQYIYNFFLGGSNLLQKSSQMLSLCTPSLKCKRNGPWRPWTAAESVGSWSVSEEKEFFHEIWIWTLFYITLKFGCLKCVIVSLLYALPWYTSGS